MKQSFRPAPLKVWALATLLMTLVLGGLAVAVLLFDLPLGFMV